MFLLTINIWIGHSTVKLEGGGTASFFKSQNTDHSSGFVFKPVTAQGNLGVQERRVYRIGTSDLPQRDDQRSLDT